MCDQCDYNELLVRAGLEVNANRLHVMEVIGANQFPLTAADVFHTVGRTQAMNRVTVYRILDTLVELKILEKITIGGRAAHYGLAPNENHPAHPHFYCKICGKLDCLTPESLSVNSENLLKTFPGQVEKIDICVEGICRNCLRRKSN